MFPEMPEAEAAILDNPYQYTDYVDESKRGRRRGARPRPLRSDGTGRGHGRARYRTRLRRGAGPRASTCSPASTPTTGRCRYRGRRGGRAGPADRPPAAAHPRGAGLRPLRAAAAFALTPKVLTLGMAYVGALGLWDIARPHLRGAGRADRRVVVDGAARRLATSSTSPGCPCRRSSRCGSTSARASRPSQTSQGKVLLAALAPDRARGDPRRAQPGRAAAVHRPLPRAARATSSPRCGPAGWALADEELAPGVRSVAVPVRDGDGAVRAAMNVTVHAAETSTETLLHEYLPAAAADGRRRQRASGRCGSPARTSRWRGRGPRPPDRGRSPLGCRACGSARRSAFTRTANGTTLAYQVLGEGDARPGVPASAGRAISR